MGKTLRLFILASLVVAPSAYAQIHSSAGLTTPTTISAGSVASTALNDARNGIDSQFAPAIEAQQQAVSQAQMALQDCASQQQRAYNDAAGQKAQNEGQQKQQAAQDIANNLPNTLGPLANALTSGGNKQRKLGQQAMKDAASQIANLNSDIANAVGTDPSTNPAIRVTAVGVNLSQRAQVSAACRQPEFQNQYGGFGGNYDPSHTQPTVIGGSPEQMCLMNINSMVMGLNNQFQQGRTAYVGGQSIGGAAMQSALNSLVGALGAGLKAKANKDNNKMQDDSANQNADLDRQICEQQAQAQIAEAQKQLQNLQNQRSRALLDANLQAAAAQQAAKPTATLGQDAGGTVNVGDAPTLPTAAPTALAAAGGNNSGSGGGAGAVAPSGANSAGGAAEWTFGSGGPAAIAASAPLPGASFEQSGGGGGGGGFSGGADNSGFATDPLADMNKYAGDRTVASGDVGGPLGDGGINVLINRARGVLGNYAPTLVKSLDLKKIMAMSPTKAIQAQ